MPDPRFTEAARNLIQDIELKQYGRDGDECCGLIIKFHGLDSPAGPAPSVVEFAQALASRLPKGKGEYLHHRVLEKKEKHPSIGFHSAYRQYTLDDGINFGAEWIIRLAETTGMSTEEVLEKVGVKGKPDELSPVVIDLRDEQRVLSGRYISADELRPAVQRLQATKSRGG